MVKSPEVVDALFQPVERPTDLAVPSEPTAFSVVGVCAEMLGYSLPVLSSNPAYGSVFIEVLLRTLLQRGSCHNQVEEFSVQTPARCQPHGGF